jgi:hypothetical protein
MPIGEKNCDNYSRLFRRSLGFTYASFQNHFMGRDPIILSDAYSDGEDLRFSAPWEFVEENHLSGTYGLTEDDASEAYTHVSSCEGDVCREALELLHLISGFIGKEDTPLSGVLLASVFHPRDGSQPLVLTRDNGFEEPIILLRPVFRMYRDRRDDFVWPGEGRIRLEGYLRVRYGPGSEGISLVGLGIGDSVVVPYESVRKVRVDDRDIWRNTDIYHVEVSHSNETSFDKSGPVALELREDRDGAEKLASEIASKEKRLKRVG